MSKAYQLRAVSHILFVEGPFRRNLYSIVSSISGSLALATNFIEFPIYAGLEAFDDISIQAGGVLLE